MQNLDELIKSSKSLGRFFKGASALIELADSIESDKAEHEALKKTVAVLHEEAEAQAQKTLAAKEAAQAAMERAKQQILDAQEQARIECERIEKETEQYRKDKEAETRVRLAHFQSAEDEAQKQLALVLADVAKAEGERDKLNAEIDSILAKLRK